MCMLFRKTSKVTLPESYYNDLWSHNSDGLGIWNFSQKKLVKTMSKSKGWKYIQDHQKDDLMIHFRFATSGDKNCQLAHPFYVGENKILFHNGVLNTFRGTFEKSDTWQLAQAFKESGATTKQMVNWLEKNERSSRFVIIDTVTNEVTTPNCAAWHCHKLPDDGGEINFSNTYAISSTILYGYGKSRWWANDDDYYYGSKTTTYPKTPSVDLLTEAGKDTLEDYDELMNALAKGYNTKDLLALVAQNPLQTTMLLCNIWQQLEEMGLDAVDEFYASQQLDQ